MSRSFLFCLNILSILVYNEKLHARDVVMKVVDEPSNFGYPYQEQTAEETTLKMRVIPSNFSGPLHLKQLFGKCYTKVDEQYKYEFCPFVNVTQHEQSLRWNPYSGILGVWQEWNIVNNTYQAMILSEGDACGVKQRSTKVIFKCGENDEVLSVTEPETCIYELKFLTPLVCHPHSMLVYPTLSENLRHDWDLLESQYKSGEYTVKGYNKKLNLIYENAGLILSASMKKQVADSAQKKEQEAVNLETGDFDSLHQCSQEYKKLKEEISGLRSLLSVYQQTNGTEMNLKRLQNKQSKDEHGTEDYEHNPHYDDY